MDPFLGIGILGTGITLGYVTHAVYRKIQNRSVDNAIAERILRARETAQEIITDAHLHAQAKERILTEQLQSLEEKLVTLHQTELLAVQYVNEQYSLLQQIATLSTEEARNLLLKKIEKDHQEDFILQSRKLEQQSQELLQQKARTMLAGVIQRIATTATVDLTTTVINIPNDDVKGKIIGKEGRNIRCFEHTAGVELLVDETPNTITISCFDPVRRAIAAQALEVLIADGRIQPSKIEEEVEEARKNIHHIIKEKGAEAVYECGIYNFDPRLISILGRLYFRTSYGQNVLAHSIEMAHIAEMLASELGADPYIAKAAALVHDIGKALDHEFEGGHVAIGIKVLRRFDTDERVITAMQSHHDDVPHESIEAIIVQIADSISSARPGARSETVTSYVQRIDHLEKTALRFSGVEKAYAIEAGRELRVFISPEHISEQEARTLARTIARTIEQELRYPGTIKITMIRESRIIEYAR